MSCQFYVAISLAINNAVEPERRGGANGISMTASSFARVILPVFFAAMFAISIDGDRPSPFDYHLVFYLLASIRLIVACMGWKRTKTNVDMETGHTRREEITPTVLEQG